MSGETGVTKIDIITTTGLTLSDGSILDIGGIMKISTEFPSGYSGFRFEIQTYRSLQIFKVGYKPVEVMKFETSGEHYLGNELANINMAMVYSIVADFINTQFSSPVCEVVVYEESI